MDRNRQYGSRVDQLNAKMKDRPTAWLLTFLLAAILLGCTVDNRRSAGDDEPEPPAGVELIRAEVGREQPAEVEEETAASLVEGSNAFAFDLYQELAPAGGNLIFSPYSISQAFSMVYGGAQGETAMQMARVLRLLPPETQHQAFNALDQHIAGLNEGADGISGNLERRDELGDPFQLNSANAVWVQEGYPLRDAYLALLAQHYGSGLWQVDFAAEQEMAKGAINTWVAQATGGRIEQLAPPLDISAATRLALANAIYFKASWLYRFDEDGTKEGPFTLLDGNRVTAPFMHGEPRVPYIEGEDFQAIRLPYAGSSVEMLAILPAEEQWQAVEERLSAAFVADIRQRTEAHDVTLTMPRFSFANTIRLQDTLQGMGLTIPFSPNEADFGGMVEGGDLFIGDAVHKGTITVDEKGTEAAAVTGIEMEIMEYPRAELVLDHPFIFAIVERETGAILLLGRVLNPAATG